MQVRRQLQVVVTAAVLTALEVQRLNRTITGTTDPHPTDVTTTLKEAVRTHLNYRLHGGRWHSKLRLSERRASLC